MLILTSLLLISGVCVAVDLTINGSVGGTVELPSVLGSLKVEDFRFVWWIFNGKIRAEISSGHIEVDNQAQFKGRLQLSPDFSLTVRELRLEDSGEYQRVGLKEDGSQIPTYKIQLQVNESITTVQIQSELTWLPEILTCAAYLVCSSTGDPRPSYTWKKGKQRESSSELRFFLLPEEGDVIASCTAANSASEKTSNVTMRCIPTVLTPLVPPVGFSPCLLKMVVFSVGLIIMVSAVITVHLRERFYRQREHVQGAETEGTAPPGGRL
ncbi:SLAM family member 6-like isoform X1 [Paramormyrops kingsleyae]|uniref:SLAM family member 6-like isoform X1 n=1 Tax=Paramormyrops kingsleyae TaxID=1676925 RepID=UPI003B978938